MEPITNFERYPPPKKNLPVGKTITSAVKNHTFLKKVPYVVIFRRSDLFPIFANSPEELFLSVFVSYRSQIRTFGDQNDLQAIRDPLTALHFVVINPNFRKLS